MRFALCLLSAAAAVFAQSGKPNSFNLPDDGTQVFNAGQSTELTWSNPTGSTITLILVDSSNSNLQNVSTIVSNYQNSGSYIWTPDVNLPEEADYAIEIIDDQDTSIVNYTPQFVIKSNIRPGLSTTSTTTTTTWSPTTTTTTTTTTSSPTTTTAMTTTTTTTATITTSTPMTTSTRLKACSARGK